MCTDCPALFDERIAHLRGKPPAAIGAAPRLSPTSDLPAPGFSSTPAFSSPAPIQTRQGLLLLSVILQPRNKERQRRDSAKEQYVHIRYQWHYNRRRKVERSPDVEPAGENTRLEHHHHPRRDCHRRRKGQRGEWNEPFNPKHPDTGAHSRGPGMRNLSLHEQDRSGGLTKLPQHGTPRQEPHRPDAHVPDVMIQLRPLHDLCEQAQQEDHDAVPHPELAPVFQNVGVVRFAKDAGQKEPQSARGCRDRLTSSVGFEISRQRTGGWVAEFWRLLETLQTDEFEFAVDR